MDSHERDYTRTYEITSFGLTHLTGMQNSPLWERLNISKAKLDKLILNLNLDFVIGRNISVMVAAPEQKIADISVDCIIKMTD